jgi:hypothetical protein
LEQVIDYLRDWFTTSPIQNGIGSDL